MFKYATLSLIALLSSISAFAEGGEEKEVSSVEVSVQDSSGSDNSASVAE